MKEKNLPRYVEDEVKEFHPFFEECAKEAIKNLSKNNLIVSHHKNINGIIVDYSIEDLISNKIVLLVEIKRTKSSINSTRNRYQALSYRKEADLQCATPYYLLTNLERTEVFRYDPNKPRVNNQLIKGSPFDAGDLENNEYDYFYNNFVKILETIIDIVIEDKGEYGYNLDSFYNLLSSSLYDYREWHKVFMPFSFEYIRGASDNYSKLYEKILKYNWKSADSYIKNPEMISIKGSKVDFHHIFKEPFPITNSPKLFDSFLLENAFNIGKKSGQGEEVKELVSDLLISEFKGVVETDPELADLLSVLARNELGRSLTKDEWICDPAAGGGQLLSSAASLSFKNVEPNRIFANEIKPFFSEILSLRLGLLFANKISLENSPKITINNVADLNKNNFLNKKVILLNPPFINSVESKQEKIYIQKKIKNLKNICITDTGQIGLEGSFLELVTSLAQENSIIGAIMPLNLLTRKGYAIKRFRKYLLDDFGLSMICTYPREGLFEDVKKRTCILIGRIGNKNKSIKWIEINTSIERINFEVMLSSLEDSNRIYSTDIFSKNYLRESLDKGWNIKLKKNSREWFLSIFNSKTILINEIFKNIKRGKSGNNGSSDLCAIPVTTKYKFLLDLIPKGKQIPAINKSKNLEKFLDTSNAKWISPELDFEEDIFLKELIDSYIKFRKDNEKKGKQTKAPIDEKKVKLALKTIDIYPKWSVLIPRNIRSFGSIALLNEPHNISTNFIVVSCKNKKEAITLASWLFSIFGQLQMEYLCNDQEGTRKLEKIEINQILIPITYKNISNKDFMSFEKLFEEELPLEFRNIKIRKIDEEWAKLLFKNHDEILQEALEIMEDLIEERSP